MSLVSSKTVIMYKIRLTSNLLYFLHVLSDKEYNFLKGYQIAMLVIYIFMVCLKTVSVASRQVLSM